MGYRLDVFYSYATPERREVSEKVFRMIAERGLDFSAGISCVPHGHDLQAIRVIISSGNVNTGYSPLAHMKQFEEALDNLKKSHLEEAVSGA